MSFPVPGHLTTLGPLLQVRDVSLGYVAETNKPAESVFTMDNNENKIILSHITLDIEKHSRIAILGKNGCGKVYLMFLH